MSKQPRVLNGKTAIVTGATGGVGKATAKALAREGVKVAMADLDQQAVEDAAREVGSGAIGMALDVTDLDAYTRFIDEVESRLGPLDILCNVAGIMPIGRFEEERDTISARIIDVNLTAVVHSTKDAARRMLARGSGHIVNVASGAGWIAGGGGATYCASKFGVVGYSESVALELRGTGVEISVVAPAVIKTEMSVGLKEVKGVRASEPEEVAAAIVDGLKRPKFAIFVPKAIGIMAMSFSAMPYRIRHFLARSANTDKLLLDFDATARAGYEDRVAQTATKPRRSASKKPATAASTNGESAPAEVEVK
jgi:short-subunit dehydrogenase